FYRMTANRAMQTAWPGKARHAASPQGVGTKRCGPRQELSHRGPHTVDTADDTIVALGRREALRPSRLGLESRRSAGAAMEASRRANVADAAYLSCWGPQQALASSQHLAPSAQHFCGAWQQARFSSQHFMPLAQ